MRFGYVWLALLLLVFAGSASAGVCSAAAPWEQSLNITNPTANGALTPGYFYVNFSNTTGHTQGNFSDFRICNSSGAYVPYAIEYSVNGTFAGIIAKPAYVPTGTGAYWADWGVAGDSNATALSVLLNGDSANYQVDANNFAVGVGGLGGTVVTGSGWVGCYGGACTLPGNWTYPMTVTVWAMLQNMTPGGYFGMAASDGSLGGSASSNLYIGFNTSLGGKFYTMRYDNATTYQLGIEFGKAYNGTLVRYEATFINGSSLSYMNGTTSQQGSVFNVSDNRQPNGNGTARMRFQVRSDASIMSTWRFYSISSRPGFGAPINTSLANGLKASAVASNTLNSPTTGSILNNLTLVFNYTPANFVPRNATLFANFSGAWAANQTNASVVVNGSGNTITVLNIPDGLYVWNVGAHNGTQFIFASTNNSLIIDDTPPVIALNAPADLTAFANKNVSVNATITDNFNVTNVSLWTNASGTWALNATNSTPLNNSLTNFTLYSLPNATGVVWAIQACDWLGQCTFSANRTLIVQYYQFSTDAVNYTENALATATISVYGVLAPTAYAFSISLAYANGTTAVYSSTTTITSNFNLSVVFPLGVNALPQEARNFTATLNGTTIGQANDSSYMIILTNCSAASNSTQKTLTFFLIDESTETAIYNTSTQITINASTSRMSRGYNFTFNLTGQNTNNFSYCIYPQWAAYSSSGIADYWADGYATREYVFSPSISNTTQNIYFYMLASSLAAQVVVTTVDYAQIPQQNLIIQAQRYFAGLNAYRSVAQGVTDYLGHASLYLLPNADYYRFIVQNNSAVVTTYTPVVVTCASGAICPPYYITFTLNSNQSPYYQQLSGFSWSCADFNNATGQISCTVVDNTGVTTKISVVADTFGAVSYVRQCQTNVSSSAGTAVCTLTNWSNKRVRWQLWVWDYNNNPTLVTQAIIDTTTRAFDWGSYGILVTLIIVLVCFFLGAWNPNIAMLFAVVGAAFSWWIGALAVSASALLGLALVVAIVIWRSRG